MTDQLLGFTETNNWLEQQNDFVSIEEIKYFYCPNKILVSTDKTFVVPEISWLFQTKLIGSTRILIDYSSFVK